MTGRKRTIKVLSDGTLEDEEAMSRFVTLTRIRNGDACPDGPRCRRHTNRVTITESEARAMWGDR